jgi:polysaccharide biosynthesis transport protein
MVCLSSGEYDNTGYKNMIEQKQNQVIPARMPRPFAANSAATAVTMTPKDIIVVLRRHILLIISIAILGLIIGGVSWFLFLQYYPRYTAITYIRVLSPTEKDPTVFGGAVDNKDIQYGHRLSIAKLITQRNMLTELIRRDKVRQTKWFQNFGNIEDKRITKAIKNLENYFGVYADRDAEFVSVFMTCGDKSESALIVNEMVSLFLDSQGATKKQEIAERLARLNDQQNRVESSLAMAESSLDDVRKRWGFGDLEDKSFESTTMRTLNDLELQQSKLILDISEIQANVESLKNRAVGPMTEQTERQIETDPIMLSLAQQGALLEAALAGRLTKFGENHKAVKEIQEQIKAIGEERELRKAVIAEQFRQANLKDAQDQLVALQSKLGQLEEMRKAAIAKQNDFDLAKVQYQKRLAVRDERKERLNEIKASIEKLKILHDDPETPKVQFIGNALEPLEVSFPRWEIFFPGGTMLGVMLGIGLAFLIEILNDLVRTPRDVTRYLNIPLLGIIPDANEDKQLADIGPYQVVRLAPYSIISESYRRFRTNLKLFGSMESSKAFLITSGTSGDGRTSVAVNLATTFVAEFKKVLLVDANFWKPSLHSIFPRPVLEKPVDQAEQTLMPEFGLSTLLAGLCGYQEVIRPSGIDGLDIIDAGILPSNPAELISGKQMEQLIKHQRQIYDYVIIDGPPVLLVSDVKNLAKFVDSSILVLNAAATRRGAALRTIRELNEVDAKIAGVVLLAVKALKGGYYAEQGKAYTEYQKLQLANAT